MIPEAHEECAVVGAEHVVQEDFEVVPVLFVEAFLTAAGVEDEAEGERNVEAASEMGDLLGHGVFGDLEVIFGEVVDEGTVDIANGKGDGNEVDVDKDGFLGARGGAGQRQYRCCYSKPSRGSVHNFTSQVECDIGNLQTIKRLILFPATKTTDLPGSTFGITMIRGGRYGRLGGISQTNRENGHQRNAVDEGIRWSSPPGRKTVPLQPGMAGALGEARYSVAVRLWTCCSRAWLYWRSIWSSVWSFLIRSSRRAISVRSLTTSGPAAVARNAEDGGAGGAGLGVKASARARGQTESAGFISGALGGMV